MNTIIENILTRRSIRSFIEKEIPENELTEILKSAVYAPSGMNKQTWKFTAICNKNKINQIAEVISKVLDREGYNFYNPAVLILASNEKDSIWGKEDNACALQNIFLSAHSYGIGSVWINQFQNICDKPEIRKILKDLEIPDNHIVYGSAALGYAAENPPAEVNKTGVINIIK